MQNKLIVPHETDQIKEEFAKHGLFYSESYKEEGKSNFKVITYSFKVEKDNNGKREEVFSKDVKQKMVGLTPDELSNIRQSMVKEVLPKIIEDGKDKSDTQGGPEAN